MNKRIANEACRTTIGALEQIDLLNRTIEVLVGSIRLSFDVPPQCEVALNAERVKLRVLQPGDLVAIVHGMDKADQVARRIDVVSHVSGRRARVSAGAS